MRHSGRVSAAIEILSDFETRRVPLKTALADWGRQNRYAGAKDRAWISGLCLDVLRRRQSLAEFMAEQTARAAILAALRFLWRFPLNEIEDICVEEPHGPGSLNDDEREKLAREPVDADWQLDVPEFAMPLLIRSFRDTANLEANDMSKRAPVDLRINTLKSTEEKTLQALKSVKGKAVPVLKNSARITAPDPSEKAPSVTIIPAFNKGWVEVQDLGSQLAAAASGNIKGKQVLDFCAGGGGKTLALAAMMENTGQLHAYDIDARRLKPLYARAKRAGLRNLQIMPPEHRNATPAETLTNLVDKMDVVFVDAPCSGAGTWRRHPDTKWRLTEQQLLRRQGEQDNVLRQARQFVRPGGLLIYVTCSIFMEENEDRLDAFLAEHPEFHLQSAIESLQESELLKDDGRQMLEKCLTPTGCLRLSPYRSDTDGFFISVLKKNR